MSQQIVVLNVGGVYFWTTRSTLVGISDTFFCKLMGSHFNTDGCYFIDRDPSHFRHILNHLRGSTVLPHDAMTLQELQVEADFYCLRELADTIHKLLSNTTLKNLPVPPLDYTLHRISQKM